MRGQKQAKERDTQSDRADKRAQKDAKNLHEVEDAKEPDGEVEDKQKLPWKSVEGA